MGLDLMYNVSAFKLMAPSFVKSLNYITMDFKPGYLIMINEVIIYSTKHVPTINKTIAENVIVVVVATEYIH